MRSATDYVTSKIPPGVGTMQNLQYATWAIYATALISAVVIVGGLMRGAVQWRACQNLQRMTRSDNRILTELREQIAVTGQALAIQHVDCGWLEGPSELAARLENGAKQYGVGIISFVPTEAEAEEAPDKGPSPDLLVKSQSISLKAHGDYQGALKWIRWLSSPAMPIKLESITMYPKGGASAPASVGMDFKLTLYSPKDKAGT